MFLSKYELIPSVIVDVDDPLHIGRIKCHIPGKIDTQQITNTDNIPWVYPLNMKGYQSFSKMIVGGKVMVWANSDNYLEYWYEPMHEVSAKMKEYLDEHYNDNPEVLMFRDLGGKSVMMSYDDISGINIYHGDNYIKMLPSGDIEIKGSSGNIAIRSGTVHLGAESGPYTLAVRSDIFTEFINKIKSAAQIGLASSGNNAKPAGEAFQQIFEACNSYSTEDQVGSTKVKIST